MDSTSLTRRAVDAGGDRHHVEVLAGGAARVEDGGVDRRADLADRVGAGRDRCGRRTWPGLTTGRSRPSIIRIVVVLPEPLRPRNPVTRPLRTPKRQVVDGGDVAEALAEVLDVDGGVHG